MKPKLYYCNTHYTTSPPTDINPLLLQRYPNHKMLVLCAREPMIKRIDALCLPRVLCVGWWDLEEAGLFERGFLCFDELYSYDVVVIIGRDRIDNSFCSILKQIEHILKCS
jgi:hypothetical protein